ncbi:hypothetical protein ANO11243_006990 [Dothideomycetidae sp. 11243]|nr:hypothetical protein ANO11243_006990 [fungal sp. No.11243]
MAPADVPNGIILYHYPFSPYARRIVWYMTLRKIEYAQCLQPPTLPRPDLATLGVAYRRIPLLSINGSMYVDTRLILSKLESLFPASDAHPAISSSSTAGLSALLSSFTIDGGVFARSAQLMPTSLPVFKDDRFAKDRTDFTGSKFSPELLDRIRPEALAHMRRAFDTYEALLADGRDWIAGTSSSGPGLPDIEGVWPLDWMRDLQSLPEELFGARAYPKTNAWIDRFRAAVRKAPVRAVKVKGDAAAEFILSAQPERKNLVVDAADPLPFKKGMQVLVFPTDTGASHKDRGELVALDKDEVVIAVQTKRDPAKKILLHAPRTGFRIIPAGPAKL